MMDSVNVYFIICVLCFPSLVIGTVTISFDPAKTPLTNSVDITCTLTGSSSNAVTWNFGSTTTSCGSGLCSPNPSPHTYSMSGNVYTLTLPSAAIANCISYSCADAVISADTISEDLFVSYFDKADIVPTEPGANSDGTISVTTGCVLSPSDLTITWSKIQGGVEVTFTPDHPINTSDRSTCTQTCHSEEDEKVTNGFNHTEYTGDNFVVVQYQVNVSHKSYPDAADLYTWTSASYKIEAATTTTTSTTTTKPATTTTSSPTVTTTPVTTTTTPSTTTTTTSNTTTSSPTTTTPVTTTTTIPSTTTTTTSTTTTSSPTTTTTAPVTTITKPVTTTSTTSLSDEMIIVIVIVPVGVIVGAVIFSCLFYRLRRGKRKPASHERHKQRKIYKGDLRPVQQHQQQPYILYGRGHKRELNHKKTKMHDDRYKWYDGYHWGSQVKQNPMYKGDRNLSRLYYNETLPRYDDYRSGYIRGHVYPSHTSQYQYRPDYHGDSRQHGNRQHCSYPVYSRHQEYINPSYSYMGY